MHRGAGHRVVGCRVPRSPGGAAFRTARHTAAHLRDRWAAWRRVPRTLRAREVGKQEWARRKSPRRSGSCVRQAPAVYATAQKVNGAVRAGPCLFMRAQTLVSRLAQGSAHPVAAARRARAATSLCECVRNPAARQDFSTCAHERT
jgi:hypothetical protein